MTAYLFTWNTCSLNLIEFKQWENRKLKDVLSEMGQSVYKYSLECSLEKPVLLIIQASAFLNLRKYDALLLPLNVGVKIIRKTGDPLLHY